jgi:hypothetical protein
MKTLIKLDSGVSVYIFNDATFISQNSTGTIIGNPIEFSILDCNLNNSKISENITPPSDWVGGKYLFDGLAWTLNPDYVEPITPE